jgi:deoxyadenosine/deoxycytidine kinase
MMISLCSHGCKLKQVEIVVNDSQTKTFSNRIYAVDYAKKYASLHYKLSTIKYTVRLYNRQVKMSIERITIDGNIGAGKSTLLAEFKKSYAETHSYNIVFEPKCVWDSIVDVQNRSTMQLMYTDAATYGFATQIVCQLARRNVEYKSDMVNICERDLWSGNVIFGEQLVEDGLLSPSQHEFVVKNIVQEDAILRVYLDTPSDECIRRIGERRAEGEETIDPAYVTKLGARYDAQAYGLVLDGMKSVEYNARLLLERLDEFFVSKGDTVQF